MPITVWAERVNALPGWNAGPSQGCHHVFVHLDDIKGEHRNAEILAKEVFNSRKYLSCRIFLSFSGFLGNWLT